LCRPSWSPVGLSAALDGTRSYTEVVKPAGTEIAAVGAERKLTQGAAGKVTHLVGLKV
jgi:hypothetical protein